MKRNKKRLMLSEGMPQIIARIRPPLGANREEWGTAIDRELMKIWIELGNLKPAKVRALYRLITGKARKRASIPNQLQMQKLDEIIIAQAPTLGWRIMTSQIVLFRCSRWSDELFVPEMFERFGKMMARSVRIIMCEESPPIDDPGLRDYKKRAVTELRVLLREMRLSSVGRSPAPNTKKLARWFVKKIANDARFARLNMNYLHWIVFLAEEDNADILMLQLTGRLAPSALFDSWLADFKRHDPEYLRKRLTRLRPSK